MRDLQKQCSKCHQVKSVTDFHRRRGRGYQSWCKSCIKTEAQSDKARRRRIRYYAKHKTEMNRKTRIWDSTHSGQKKAVGRTHYYRFYFNLSLDDVETIKQFQRSLCAICGRLLTKANIDHDHASGLIRGALCWNCNVMLGRARDSIDRLQKAIAYLTSPPAILALGAPRYGLPGRVGSKKQRALSKKLERQRLIKSQKPLDKVVIKPYTDFGGFNVYAPDTDSNHSHQPD